MAHIRLPGGMPGIIGALALRPETAKRLLELAEVLLRGPNTLTPAEREMIAAHVSYHNDGTFCQLSHGAAAAAQLHGNYESVEQIKRNPETADICAKLKALLRIAGKVQLGGKHVSGAEVKRARERGASDKETHHTALIAAAFCMFNRYVDGLAAWQPKNPEVYREIGQQTARLGYVSRDYKRPLDAITAKRASSVKQVARS